MTDGNANLSAAQMGPWVSRGQRKQAVGYGSAQQTAQQARSQQPVADGKVRCSYCSNDLPLKTDGTLRRHNSRRGISCPGGGEQP